MWRPTSAETERESQTLAVGRGHEVPCLAEEMLTTDSFWRQGVGFLEGRGPWYVDQTPEDDTTPKSIWVHKLDLIGFVKQTERGHKAGWVEGEGLWEDLCK